MLNYSKERVPSIEPTNINQIVTDVVELLKGRVTEQGVQFQLQLDPELPVVQADPEGIHRAVLNILGNALDAVSDRQEPQVGIRTLVETGGEWLAIAVVDNGAGIPPDKLAEIFKPFVSSKGTRGTGLGLPVSRKILLEHGGDLTVKSKQGKGSQFTLRLPLKSPLAIDASHAMQQTILPPAS
jgi:signal transduction histidine kinase